MPYRGVTFITHIEDDQVEVSASVFLSDDPWLHGSVINAYIEDVRIYLSAPPHEEVDYSRLPTEVQNRIHNEILEHT